MAAKPRGEAALRKRVVSLQGKLARARDGAKKARAKLRRQEQRISSLTKQLADQKAAVPGSPIFFIVGQAKSGTSWTMRMLDAHPEVIARGEGRFVGRSYKRPDVMRMDSKTWQPSSLQRAILDSEYLRAWVERSVWTRGGDPEKELAKVTAVAATHFLTMQGAGTKTRLVGDKTPFLSEDTIAELAEVFERPRVIHVVRDGRDVAVSAMHHLWNHPIDLGGGLDLTPEEEEARDRYRRNPKAFLEAGESIFTEARLIHQAKSWQSQVARAMTDGRSLLGERYLEVRYESLLKRPASEAARLFRFLEVDASASVVRRSVRQARFEQFSRGRKRGREDSRSFYRKGIAGDWRNFFTPRDEAIFLEHARDLLAELGYLKAS